MSIKNDENPVIYEFDGFRLDVAKRLVFGADNKSLSLKAKAFETLLFLVENPGRVIERDEIMEAVWPDTVVEENNLTQHIASLRRLFGETKDDHRFIVTVPGRGYKFVASTRIAPASDESAVMVEKTELTQSGAHRRYDIERRGNVLAVVDWTDKDLELSEDTGPRPVPAKKPKRWLLIAFTVLGVVIVGSLGFYRWRTNTQPAPAPIKSIAVLPFKPLVAENRDESLEMGIADALISKLNGGEQLTVRPLAVVRRFASLEQDPLAAGRELGVEAVLEGSVQKANDRIRISVKLLRVSDGKQIWAQLFDEPLADIFRLQDSISEHVSSALQIPLGTRVIRDYTDSVEAYQLYMNGRLHTGRLVPPEALKGIRYYEQAIEKDPGYTLAYVGLAQAYRALVLSGDKDPSEVMPKAKDAALRAVELDPGNADAHVALANSFFWYEWDWRSAEQHFLRAIELDPRSPLAHLFYGHFLSNTGRHEQAIEEVRKGRELDPVNPYALAFEGQILMFAGRHDDAVKALRLAVELDPNFWLSHLFLTKLYIEMAMYDDAIKEGELAGKLSGDNAEAASLVAYALAKSGNRDSARHILEDLEDRARSRYVPAYTIAGIYNALDDKDNALNMLEKSFEQKDALMVFLKVEPKWNNLRSEPRFIDLMRRMNLE